MAEYLRFLTRKGCMLPETRAILKPRARRSETALEAFVNL